MEHRELVIVALGSVQPFIADSRRTQDLLTSSQLYSLLARIGVKTAALQPDTKLIFPSKLSEDCMQSIPNRFVFLTPAGHGKSIAAQVQQRIKEAWDSIAHQVQEFFSTIAPEKGWETIWERQVATGPEMYWVVYPLSKSNDYKKTYYYANLALDARKRVRWYPTEAEPGEKCTLDGIHQALSGNNQTRREDIRGFWQSIANHTTITPSEIREGERLCAISAIKRFAAKPTANVTIDGYSLPQERFPSTSSIAAASFRQALWDHWDSLQETTCKHLVMLDCLSDKIRRSSAEKVPFFNEKTAATRLLHYDGDVLYRDTFTQSRLKEMLGKSPDEKAIQDTLKTLRDLYQQARKLKIHLPNPYLAVLMLDGDEMGAFLGECETPEQHEQVSSILMDLVTDMQQIVEIEHPGCLIYASGDDLLALLPARDALTVANKLQQTFQSQLEQAGYPDRSVSCGIALVHHLQPLEWALRAARQAVERAKEHYERAALVVHFIRRSGEGVLVGAKWNYDDMNTLAVMKYIQDAIECDDLSGKIGYDMLEVAPVLIGQPIRSHRIPFQAQQAELQRLFKRRANEQKKSKEEAVRLATIVSDLVRSMSVANPIKEVSLWLILVRFFAQGGDI
jgi:CRISPR-associated protein Cmr2